MATLAQLVEKVKNRLGGNTTTVSAALTESATAGALSLSLDDATGFSRGLVEVDHELMRVNAVNLTTGSLTIPAYGRGYKGTAPAVHAAGAEVRFNPPWPNAVIAGELNGVIRSLFPMLYGVKVHETTFPTDRRRAIDVPTDAIGIVSVWITDASLPDDWVLENRWAFNPDSSDVGRPLRVGGRWGPADPVRVVYATRPTEFDLTTPAQEFEAATGLPERLEELVVLGVTARLAPYLDINRLQSLSAEARMDPQARPVGQATVTGRMLRQEYEALLDRERQALNREHPIKVHRTG